MELLLILAFSVSLIKYIFHVALFLMSPKLYVWFIKKAKGAHIAHEISCINCQISFFFSLIYFTNDSCFDPLG